MPINSSRCRGTNYRTADTALIYPTTSLMPFWLRVSEAVLDCSTALSKDFSALEAAFVGQEHSWMDLHSRPLVAFSGVRPIL